MQRPGEAAQLDPRVLEIAARFHGAWQGEGSPELTKFLLPANDPLQVQCLQELVRIDLKFRWERGQKPLLEEYVQRFPSLGAKETLPTELIYEEYKARRLHGDGPTIDSYIGRFPRQFQALQRLLHRRPVDAPGRDVAAKQQPPQVETVLFTPGQVLPFGGGYKLIWKLGSGSYADVWQAEAPGGFPVAIKKLHHSVDREEAQQELQALETIKRLRHIHLLQTQASFVYGGYLFIVMDLAECTLADRLKDCPEGIPPRELLGYMREASEALDYMHGEHVHHRDIKPANILLTNGHVKVADLGMALVMEMSVQGSLAGTLAYMAPEVVQHRPSRQSDQYSLAMTYAHLRLGRHPLPKSSFYDLLQSIGKPVNLEGLPAAEQGVVHRALSVETKDRFPTCSDFAKALEEALAEKPREPAPAVVPLPSPPPSPAPLPPRRSRLLWLAALVPVIAGLLLAGWLAFRPRFDIHIPDLPELVPGRITPVTVEIARANHHEKIELDFGDAEGIYVAPTSVDAERGSTVVDVGVFPNARPGTVKLQLRARSPSYQLEREVSFAVSAEPAYRMPGHWKPAEGCTSPISEHDRLFYREIDVVKEIEGAKTTQPIRFILIERGPTEAEKSLPRAFYIMRDKVWVGLFRDFAGQAKLKNKEWETRAIAESAGPINRDDLRPVMGVHVEDAQACCRWLTDGLGDLPKPIHWDKASGYYETPRGEGPYQGHWKDIRSSWWRPIAVNLKEPVRIGSSRLDVSPFGLHDMAGNGREWTRVIEYDGKEYLVGRDRDKVPNPAGVLRRGGDYRKAAPFAYADLDNDRGIAGDYDTPDMTVGFRAMFEP
jgi:serine/threonine protein kinase